jgi:hypothetical protein
MEALPLETQEKIARSRLKWKTVIENAKGNE